MPSRPKFSASERIDLGDFSYGTVDFPINEFRHRLLNIAQGSEPGGAVLDGFYVEVVDPNAREIKIVNGYALDRRAQAVYKATGATADPALLFDDPTVSKTRILDGVGQHFIEIEFTLADGADDSRAFWDPTYDNGLEPSGDPLPDGREFSQTVPTRRFPEWRIVDSAAWSWQNDVFGMASTTTLRVPLCIIDIDAAPQITNTTRTARTTIIADTDAVFPISSIIQVASARLFGAHSIDIYSETGVFIATYALSAVDYVNNTLQVAGGPIPHTDAGCTVVEVAGSPQYLTEYWGGNALTEGDFRNLRWSKDGVWEQAAINPKGIVNAPVHDFQVPTNYSYYNSDVAAYVSGTLPTFQEGPYRTDRRIKNELDFTRALEFVIREMKHGVDPGVTQDAGSEFAIESWTGIHAASEVDPIRNVPMGSLAEVGNARVHHPNLTVNRRILHPSLHEHLAAMRRKTVIVGDGVSTQGDFNGAQGLVNALYYISTYFPTDQGVLHIKQGEYDLSTVTLPAGGALPALPAYWSLSGDGRDLTHIIVDASVMFRITVASNAWEDGSFVKDLTFRSKAARTQAAGGDVAMVNFDFVIDFAPENINLLDVTNVTFINDYGAEYGGNIWWGMVWCTIDSAQVLRNLPVNFNNCRFHTGYSGVYYGQYHVSIDWTGNTGAPIAAAQFSVPIKFHGCQFSVRSSGYAGSVFYYGFHAEMFNFDDIEHQGFYFSDCEFLNGASQTTYSGASSFIKVEDAANSLDKRANLHVSGSRFIGYHTGVTDTGGSGIYFQNTVGTMTVTGCTFENLQIGVMPGRGRENIQNSSFIRCSAGIVVGADSTSSNKLEVLGCSFRGAFTELDSADSANFKANAQTMGIMFRRANKTATYGLEAEGATKLDVQVMSKASIKGCIFEGVGLGIGAFPLAVYVNSGNDLDCCLESMDISGCSFKAIPGAAIDTGWTITEDSSRRRAAIGVLTVNGNTFHNCCFRLYRAVFSNATGGAVFPFYDSATASDVYPLTHQMCVSTYAFRTNVIGNKFSAIGMGAYADDNPFGQYNLAGETRNFLGILGNDPYSAMSTLTVKGNSIEGLTNYAQDPWDPSDLNNHGIVASVNQSWAGCFWMGYCEDDGTGNPSTDDLRDTTITVDVSDNTVQGVYRTGATLGSPEMLGGNGFWFGPTTDFASPGTFKFNNNSIELHCGQHGLYIWNSNIPPNGSVYGLLFFNDMQIVGNNIKTSNTSGASSYHNGFPYTSAVGTTHLMHLAGWRSDLFWTNSGAVDHSYDPNGLVNGVQKELPLPSIIANSNALFIEGADADNDVLGTATANNTSTIGKWAGIYLDIHNSGNGSRSGIGGTGNPIAVFENNTFKSASLTLGHITQSTSPVGYHYTVRGNTFFGLIPSGIDGTDYSAGIFRGIFAHNHVHGMDTVLPYMPPEEGSTCVFQNNSIYNGTAMFRAGLENVASGNKYDWTDPEISYQLILTHNLFFGRGQGSTADGLSFNNVKTPNWKSCFDFVGGKTVTHVTLTSPPLTNNSWMWPDTDLAAWNSGSYPPNKLILVAFNIFPVNACSDDGTSQTFLFFGNDSGAASVANGDGYATLFGDTSGYPGTPGILDSDPAGLVVAGNANTNVLTTSKVRIRGSR